MMLETGELHFGVWKNRDGEEFEIDEHDPSVGCCWRSSKSGFRWYPNGRYYAGNTPYYMDLMKFVRELPAK